MLMCVAEKGDHNTTAQLRVAQKQNGRLEWKERNGEKERKTVIMLFADYYM